MVLELITKSSKDSFSPVSLSFAFLSEARILPCSPSSTLARVSATAFREN